MTKQSENLPLFLTHAALVSFFFGTMSRLLERKTSLPLLPYQDPLERHSPAPSPLSTFTAPSRTTEDDELPSHRVSLETVSSVFNHDEYETEELLKESDQPASVSTSWFTRRKSWCLSGHVKTRLNSFLIVFLAIIPSFFRKSEKRKCYPTSYLDGLRGVAALFVTQVGSRTHPTCPSKL